VCENLYSIRLNPLNLNRQFSVAGRKRINSDG